MDDGSKGTLVALGSIAVWVFIIWLLHTIGFFH